MAEVRPTDIVNGARRVLIYGVTGSGKSTLAARLSAITGLKWHSVDDLTWQPGWIPVPTDQQRSLIHSICQEPEWILDTAYGVWLDEPLRRAELIVALDYPRWFSLQRLVRRTLARAIDGQLICNGNRETFRRMVSHGLHHRLSFQVVPTQAPTHPPVDGRPKRTARSSTDFGTSDKSLAQRQALTACCGMVTGT